jgi:hypothetical protein
MFDFHAVTGDVAVAMENVLKIVESSTAKAAVGVARTAVVLAGGALLVAVVSKAIIGLHQEFRGTAPVKHEVRHVSPVWPGE